MPGHSFRSAGVAAVSQESKPLGIARCDAEPEITPTAPCKAETGDLYPSTSEDAQHQRPFHTANAALQNLSDTSHDTSAASSLPADVGTPTIKEEDAIAQPAEGSGIVKEEQDVELSEDIIAEAQGHPRRRAAETARSKMSASAAIVQDGGRTGRSSPQASKKPFRGTAASKAELEKESQFEQDGQQWEVQFKQCNAPRYNTYPRCVACIGKITGDMCRFMGLRAFAIDAERDQPFAANDAEDKIPPQFVSTRKSDQTFDLPHRESFNRPMDEAACAHIQGTIAKSLLPILERELDHARLPTALRRERETICRQMCEFCNTSIFSASWLCSCCGREYCPDCQEALRTADGSTCDALTSKLRARLSMCSRFRTHTAADLIPLTRLRVDVLEEEILVMKGLSDRGLAQQQVASGWEDDETMRPAEEPCASKDADVDWAAISSTKAGVTADMITGSLPLRCYGAQAMNNDLMEREWKHGEPLLVTDVRGLKYTWDPRAFIDRYGAEACHIVRCDRDPSWGKTDDGLVALTDVETFFKTFGAAPEEKKNLLGKGSWKLKDWPPSADFKATFPELYDDFNRVVPVPDYTRRDGVMNLASCYPRGVIQPDLGPKMYNAWSSREGPGDRGTTRLHMDMADAVNIMLYAAPPPESDDLPDEHKPGVAAWDIFRAEDADTIRRFLREELDADGNFKDDPIHTQRYFIDAELRVKLFKRYGVRGWRIYQRVGEAVFIPAGCAHQVCNLADCIKVAVDFVSPQNVERCFKLTSEFRELTNDHRAWKEDVLSLRTTLWYAWCACRQFDGAGRTVVERLAEKVKMVPQTVPQTGPATPTVALTTPVSKKAKPRASRKKRALPESGDDGDSDELTSMASSDDEDDNDEVVRSGKKKAPAIPMKKQRTAKQRREKSAPANEVDGGDESVGAGGGGASSSSKAKAKPRPRPETARKVSQAACGVGKRSEQAATTNGAARDSFDTSKLWDETLSKDMSDDYLDGLTRSCIQRLHERQRKLPTDP